MRKTLLELTQDILNDLDSDDVTSIDDTIESQQVAATIRSTYEELISSRNWPFLRKLIQLTSLNSTQKPNYMKVPDNVREIDLIKYNIIKDNETKTHYADIKYLYPDDFLSMVMDRNVDLDNVIEVTDFSGVKLAVYNNKAPEYWTSFDDKHIVFDAYDSAVDDTLKTSKSHAFAYVDPEWTHEDDFIPQLPTDAFTLLQEEAKSRAFLNLKQMANPKAEALSQKHRRRQSRKSWVTKGGIRFPNYGRK